MTGGEPPHSVLEVVELMVFGTFHLPSLGTRSCQVRSWPQTQNDGAGVLIPQRLGGYDKRITGWPIPSGPAATCPAAVAWLSAARLTYLMYRGDQGQLTEEPPYARPGKRADRAASDRNCLW